MNPHLQTVTAYREPNGRTRTEHDILTATAASRERCAKKIEGLAVQCGWQFETCPGYLDKREINVTLYRDRYAVSVSFCGGSKVHSFLAHWHTRYPANMKWPAQSPADIPPSAEYRDGFAGANCMHRRHHKATTCEDRWPVFLDKLKAGMLDLFPAATVQAAE